MKSILMSVMFFASLTVAAPNPGNPGIDSVFLKSASDSIFSMHKKQVDSFVAAHRAADSGLFAALPDSIKPQVEAATKAWRAVALADTNQRAAVVDSLQRIFSRKRDSVIAKIKDAGIQTQVRTRLGDLDAIRAVLKARLEARKAEIDARIANMKKKPGATK